MSTPFFAFYPRDWMSDPKVQLLDWKEEWAYFRLLMVCWTYDGTCTLPNDDRVLSRLLGLSREEWAAIREVLIDGEHAVFSIDEHGRIFNKRLMAEWVKAQNKSRKASQAARARWGGENEKQDSNAVAMRTHSDRNANAMPTEAEQIRTDTEHSPPKSPQGDVPGLARLRMLYENVARKQAEDNDIADMQAAIELAGEDVCLRTVAEVGQRAQLSGKRIGRFAYFLPAIRQAAGAEIARQARDPPARRLYPVLLPGDEEAVS